MKTVLQVALHHYENRIGGKFKPDRRFYNKVEINPKRFGQLLRGEKAILGYEAKNLATFFDITLDALCTKENPAPSASRAGSSPNS